MQLCFTKIPADSALDDNQGPVTQWGSPSFGAVGIRNETLYAYSLLMVLLLLLRIRLLLCM